MSELVLTEVERARADARLATLLDWYGRGLQQARLLPTLDRDRLAELLAAPIPDRGIGVDAVFDQWEDTLLANSTAVAHPRFLAYVLGPPNGIAPTPKPWPPQSTRTATSGSSLRLPASWSRQC